MPVITLPDGSQKTFAESVTVMQVAESIGAGLAAAALAGQIDDQLVDTSFVIDHDISLKIITGKDNAGLEIIRHSTAHLLAQAVQRLYPRAQVTIGPVIEDGFYYDFSYPPGFSVDDFAAIEAQMQKIVDEALPVKRSTLTREEAIDFFTQKGELYKAEIIRAIPEGETLSLYQQGEFIDLCRGPHVPNTRNLKAFKLTKVAGAYWRGDAKNEMLQRIYGTAWADKKQLDAYLTRIEEALKRDHRKIGQQLDLFHLQKEAPGMVFWHPKGWTIYQIIEQYIRKMIKADGYQEIKTPMILDRSLWEQSGHWQKFHNEMFITESEGHDFAIKPMNCPGHVQVFNQGIKSYRDLPLRLAEFGSCHRNELSGALHGLMRVRHFVQDDAHIFCTEEQVESEAQRFIVLLLKVYKDFGFTDVSVRLSTRPEERVGSDALWDKAENALQAVIEKSGLDWKLEPGDGAFYGPKISFYLQDCINRVWQCGTLQLDFSMPERLGATYIAEDGSKKIPVMLHRAITGSLERFIGVLIENYAGSFPLWLAPTQVSVLNLSPEQEAYGQEITKALTDQGFRVTFDARNEKIGFKIREHTLDRVPYMLVLGKKELADQTVAVRKRDGSDLGAMTLDAFVTHLKNEL
ncbi:MAG: threonine--tRNA ligase [Legionellales bacterium]